MLCEDPFCKVKTGITKKMAFLSEDARQATTPFPCGHCGPCRKNRARVWQTRLLLENLMNERSTFVTITYKEDDLPKDGSVHKQEMQNFVKRLRYFMPERKFKYYIVGEYGSKSMRPHYHGLFFGIDGFDASEFMKAWPKGYLYFGLVNKKTVNYITHYITKFMTKKGDKILNGKNCEFMLCSKRPPIGSEFIVQMAKKIKGERTEFINEVKIGKVGYPLGRYLTNLLYKEMNEGGKVQENFENYRKELFDVYMADDKIFIDNLKDDMQPRLIQFKERQKFFERRRVL